MDPRYIAETGKYQRWKRTEIARPKDPTLLPQLEDQGESSDAESEDYANVYDTLKDNYMQKWPDDYWKVTKLARNLKSGSPTLATLSLTSMQECCFHNAITLQALKDNNGVNLIINLLDSETKSVRLAALSCLNKLAEQKIIRYEIVYYGGLQTLVGLLWEPWLEVRIKAAEAIATISIFHRAWKIVRQCNGIILLANLLYLPNEIMTKSTEELTVDKKYCLDAAVSGARSLYILFEDHKNRMLFWKSGAVEICEKLLKCSHSELLIAVTMLLQQCALDSNFRKEFWRSGILEHIRKHLYSENQSLMQVSAQAVFRCAEDLRVREFFGEKGFLNKIYEIVSTSEYHSDQNLMASMTGALWKCCKSKSNAKRLQSVGGLQLIVQLLASQPLKVQVHIVGCLAQCIRIIQCCTLVRKNGGIEAIVSLLQTTHPPLIKNLNKAIAEASKENESMVIIDKLDAIRLVWSHLQNEDPSVITNTAWNLCTIMQNIKDSVLYVRTLLGGLELITDHLTSPCTSVLTPICAVIVALSKEMENLAILTDFQVVRLLSNLTNTKCKRLRYYLCMAIAACAPLKDNRKEFGERLVVMPLLKFLRSKYPEIQGAACHALYQMTLIPKWCSVVHKSNGIVRILINQLSSKNFEVQNCAAGVIQHIRYFSLVLDNTIPDFMDKRMEERWRYVKG